MPVQNSGKIRILSDSTINQIAAGEVVESSASVVKELIDNAIDAGAKEIIVETQGGGRGLIRVSDDGCGMDRDDLLLSVERHATSKLTSSEELFSLPTLGFRGEALPSIGSVSKLMISSSVSKGDGTALFVQGGKLEKIQSVSRRQGTTIEVRSLFFNVPVRKRFQKRVEADTANIHKVLTHAALCFPAVKLSWINGEKTAFALSMGEDLGRRIAELLGQEFHKNLLPIGRKESDLSVEGFISRPSFHRPNRRGHYLFLNGRAVVSPFVSQRIVEAYGTRLPVHRYPHFVLHLSLPHEWVDVNVHPQKKEVRLREEAAVGRFLIEAVEKTLGKEPEVVLPKSTFFPRTQPMMLGEVQPRYQVAKKPISPSLPIVEKTIRGVGFVGKYFIAKQRPDRLLIVDEREARMRIYYEKMARVDQKVVQQSLLFPISIEFSSHEASFIQGHLDLFHQAGIAIRAFGKNSFVIDGLPPFLESEEIKVVLEKLIDGFGQVKAMTQKELALSLCRLIKRRNLSMEEGERLVEELFRCEQPHQSPHGKATYLCLDEEKITELMKNAS